MPTFIKNDPEQILSEMIAAYQSKVGQVLNTADTERIMIDCLAYREMLLRGELDYFMRQNFVQYAEAEHLDNWGEILAVPRLTGESDDDYRARILQGNHAQIGTLAAYRSRIMSVPGVADIILHRKVDDNTLAPGVVRLTPLMSTQNSDAMTIGTVHNSTLQAAIDDVLYVDNFGVIGATFIYNDAIPVPLSGSVSVRSVIGYDHELLKSNVELMCKRYFASLSCKFDNVFGINDLEREIYNAEGILMVDAVDFTNVPIKRRGDFYTIGNITINVL